MPNCVIIPAVSSTPLLLNKEVLDLQNRLAFSSWIETIYPLAFVGLDGTGKKFPRVFTNVSKEYIDVMPNDNTRALSFFELNNNYKINSENEAVAQLSLNVWYNQRHLTSSSECIREQLIADILKRFIEVDVISEVEVVENYNQIFTKYDLKEQQSQYFMFPYGAFKINFNLLFDVSATCLPEFTITSTSIC